jgi:hypothetical protein
MKTGKLFLTVMSLIVFCTLITAYSGAREFGTGEVKPNNKGNGGIEIASAPPALYEVELTSLAGEIFANPKYTGKINSIRTLNSNELLGQKVEIETRTLTDGWKKLNIPPSLSGAFGLVISGNEGIVKITLPQQTSASGSGTLKSISDLFIEFGALHASFTFPEVNILEPSKFEIGILNTLDNTFINGHIIALKNNQAAVIFQNLPSSVVNKDGLIRVSLREPGGSFINSDLPAWGYNIIVSETDTGVPAPIKAEVFGLADDTKIKFNFVSLNGQTINPSSATLTVGEINNGQQISTITTKIEGPQPLTVTVTKIGS